MLNAPAEGRQSRWARALRVRRVDTQQPLHRDGQSALLAPGLPYLDSITFKPIIDPASRVDALESGTIDIMHTNTPQTFGTFRHNKKCPTWTTAARSSASRL